MGLFVGAGAVQERAGAETIKRITAESRVADGPGNDAKLDGVPAQRVAEHDGGVVQQCVSRPDIRKRWHRHAAVDVRCGALPGELSC